MTKIDAKIVLLGSMSVGKTCIACRAVSDEFDPETPSTIGSCHMEKTIELPTASVSLQVWDTAGQERFRTLAPMYYRGAVVAVLVFSVTDVRSVPDIGNWAEELKLRTDKTPVLFVVGNKMDLIEERKVATEEGEAVARDINAIYCEVSAKTGAGVRELFWKIAEEAFKRIQTKRADAAEPASATINPDNRSRAKRRRPRFC
jgi:small GTP-binding protein